MIRLLFVGWILIFSSSSFSKVLAYKPLSLAVEKGDRLNITGFHGKIIAKAEKSAKVVTVQLRQINPDSVESGLKESVDEWLFSMQKQQNIVQIHMRSPQSKTTWSRLLSSPDSQPKFELMVQMPSLPVEISWRNGDVSLSDFQDELKILAQNSNISVSEHRGSIYLSHQSGSVSLSGVKGDVNVDTYKGNVVFRDIEGQMHLENFNGNSEIIKPEGQLDFVTYNGSLKVSGGKGKVEYVNERGKVLLNKFEGNVRGVAEQGSLSAVLVGNSTVRVTSKEGSVSLNMQNSSASVNAGSKEGSINSPQFLRVTRLPNLKLVKGRLRGKNPGQIYVRTESGPIRIR